MGGKRDLNRRQRTQALLDAALPLFVEQGVEPVTIDAIAKSAGVAKGSFYRYFRDKEQLVEALVQPAADAVVSAFEDCRDALNRTPDPAALGNAYAALALALTELVLTRPLLARLYLLESRGAPRGARAPLVQLAQAVAAGAVELTRRGQELGLLRPLEPRVNALAVVGAVERLLTAHLDGDLEDLEATALGADLIELVLDGVRPRAS
ncbi:MAG: TetR/AcrR family transcriptional regulator [Planctomycetota bacterium]